MADADLQVVFLCGGTGSRLSRDPLTATRPKCLTPIGNQTLLGLLYRVLGPDDSRDAIFVHRSDDASVPAWVADYAPGAKLLPQAAPDGVANAVALALPYLRSRALVVLGDSYLAGEFEAWPATGSALCIWREADAAAIRANFGIRLEGADAVAVSEKPAETEGLACGMGVYLFERETIAGFLTAPLNPASGEREITAAIAQALANGSRFQTVAFTGRYLNINKGADLAQLEAWLGLR